MRVSFYIHSLTGGGAERVTASLARYLIGLGHDVAVITMSSEKRDFYPLDVRVRRVTLNLAGASRGFGKLIANYQRWRALRRALKAEQPNVVVAMMTTSIVFAILASIGLTARVYGSERNYPGRKPCSRPWAILRYVFYRFADAHVAQTLETAEWLRTHTGARSIHVIPNSIVWPIPDCPPAITPDSLLDGRRRLILAVGTKPYQKGFDLLLNAFAGVAEEYPEWRLVILGIPSSWGEGVALIARARELGIAQQIMFPGRVGNISDWYRRADLFVLSSRYEGFPNVLLEAMASGCACIAFDCDTGPRDIIEQGVDGVLVPAEDVAALKESLAELMGDESERERLAASAIRVREQFSEERVIGEWVKVLEQCSE